MQLAFPNGARSRRKELMQDRSATFGYHASHEQHPPSKLLEYVRLAEQAGFDAAMCSDHFHPWIEQQGHSGFTWSWLGAALQATRLTFGCVNAPGWRYHPAIIAQAAATLCEMYPQRFWLAVGSGEALNEHITGERWPVKSDRNERLLECVTVMRKLWAGETVTHRGRVVVEEAKLYTRPSKPPAVYGAALSAATAEWVGSWADGLITLGAPAAKLAEVLAAFRAGGGEGKPVKVQAALAWAPTEVEARDGAWSQWRGNVVGGDVLGILRTCADFEAASQFVTPDDVAACMPVSCDPLEHAERLQQYVDAGATDIYLFNVAPPQREFIEVFAERVLPAVRGAR
jgi:coenzyme F420-dependent glucose-6-phosphate dehydrogenase